MSVKSKINPALIKLWFCISLLYISCKPSLKTENYILCADPGLSSKGELILYKNRPFTGIIYAMYSVKDTLFYETYKEGLLQGPSKKWYPNQKPSEELFFNNGYYDGLQRGWWENERNRFLTRYRNKQLEGLSEFWYPSGMRKRNNYYKNGKEEGIQTQWGIDGRPHLSYEIKNGSIITIFRTKNCVYVQ